MAANVRYRSVYYNTTGTSVQWTLEILDTEPVGQVFNFESTKPDESFEGLTRDLKPGVYPSSLKFGMFIREAPRVVGSTTFGPSSSFIDDIATAAEGRFLARLYKDGAMVFVGPIIYDQCSWEDGADPYLMNITAVDGMNRWQTTDYLTNIGDVKYYSRTQKSFVYSSTPLTYDGPLVGASYTIIEHIVNNSPAPGGVGGGVLYTATTTWAWREIYRVESPGTGWVFQGNSRWAHEVSYTNEQTTEFLDSRYHLTRDVDEEKKRTVLELVTRAIAETNMTGEYISPAVMFDTDEEWREHDMTTGDPCNLMRIHEEPFIGKTWADVVQEICRLLFWRAYYSNGRYHFEQISTRDESTFTRYTYQYDGTLVGTETASLDLNFNTLPIKPGIGGTYRFLAPFKSVEAKVTLDGNDYLEGITWIGGQYGTRYLGRVKKDSTDQKMWVVLECAIYSTFDPSFLYIYQQSYINLICLHQISIVYSVRITNINTGVTYYLTETSPGLSSGTWETTETEINPPGNYFGHAGRRYTTTDFSHRIDRTFKMLAETLPGATDDLFDINISVSHIVKYDSAVGAEAWTTLNPTGHQVSFNAVKNSMKLYSTASLADLSNWVESEGNIELVYMSENDVDNSIKVKTELQWADTGQFKKAIEIYNGSKWKKSAEWSIGGIGTPVPIGELLVTEIMSLRTLPRKIYSGSYLSTLPNAETRFQRDTSFYLPLSCSKDTDVDTFQGEFLEIARSTPPDVDVIESPIVGLDELADLAGSLPPEDVDTTLYFETNEAITAGATLTEVDIVNTLGAYVASGETVSIVHPTSGVTENVVLTQEILPADTVMYFESNVMANSYPDASYIVVQDGDVDIESGGSKYFYSNSLYNGASHTVPIAAIDFVVFTGMTGQQINKKVKINRNGSEMFGWPFTTFAVIQSNAAWFTIDPDTNQIIFKTDFEFVDEIIVIDIDLNR